MIASTVTLDWPLSALLGGLSPASRARLLRAGAGVTFRPGQVLLREGDQGDFVLLLLRGWYRVVARAGEGEALVAVRAGGDLVGELGHLSARPRAATVRAAGEGLGRLIRGVQFRDLLAGDSEVAAAVLDQARRRMHPPAGGRPIGPAEPADVRLARVLHHLAVVHGRPVGRGRRLGLALTQKTLAALADAGDGPAHRTLTRLRHLRVIDTGYRRIVVLDPGRLAELARVGDPDAASLA